MHNIFTWGTLRAGVQLIFLLFFLFVGWMFFQFYLYLLDPRMAAVTRPPSVEAFLPISSMLALRQLIFTGQWDMIHPAGLTIMLLVLLSALLAGRAFCSWVCPIGTISDWLSRLSAWLLNKFGVKQWVPRGWKADGLKSLKWLLLLFFLYIIWAAMSLEDAIDFLHAPYNQVADLKMLLFFLQPSQLTLLVLALLAVLTIFIPGFWCRFICPYGLLAGLVGKLGLAGIIGEKKSCIQCGQCQSACSNGLNPQEKFRVSQLECTLCLQCVEKCPAKTLGLGIRLPGWHHTNYFFSLKKSAALLAVLMLLLFFGGPIVADLLGIWESKVSITELRSIMPFLELLIH